jgi:hypothetical protein
MRYNYGPVITHTSNVTKSTARTLLRRTNSKHTDNITDVGNGIKAQMTDGKLKMQEQKHIYLSTCIYLLFNIVVNSTDNAAPNERMINKLGSVVKVTD